MTSKAVPEDSSPTEGTHLTASSSAKNISTTSQTSQITPTPSKTSSFHVTRTFSSDSPSVSLKTSQLRVEEDFSGIQRTSSVSDIRNKLQEKTTSTPTNAHGREVKTFIPESLESFQVKQRQKVQQDRVLKTILNSVHRSVFTPTQRGIPVIDVKYTPPPPLPPSSSTSMGEDMYFTGEGRTLSRSQSSSPTLLPNDTSVGVASGRISPSISKLSQSYDRHSQSPPIVSHTSPTTSDQGVATPMKSHTSLSRTPSLDLTNKRFILQQFTDAMLISAEKPTFEEMLMSFATHGISEDKVSVGHWNEWQIAFREAHERLTDTNTGKETVESVKHDEREEGDREGEEEDEDEEDVKELLESELDSLLISKSDQEPVSGMKHISAEQKSYVSQDEDNVEEVELMSRQCLDDSLTYSPSETDFQTPFLPSTSFPQQYTKPLSETDNEVARVNNKHTSYQTMILLCTLLVSIIAVLITIVQGYQKEVIFSFLKL